MAPLRAPSGHHDRGRQALEATHRRFACRSPIVRGHDHVLLLHPQIAALAFRGYRGGSPTASIGTLDLSALSWAFLPYLGELATGTMTLRYPAPLSGTTSGEGVIGNPIAPVVGNEGKGTGRPTGWLRQNVPFWGTVMCRGLVRVIAHRSSSRGLEGPAPGFLASLGPHEQEPPMRFLAAHRDPHGFPVKGDVLIRRPCVVAWPGGERVANPTPHRATQEQRSIIG
jgi:hypothetical protein